MRDINTTEIFYLDYIGEDGEKYVGNFEIKLYLTRAEVFKADQIRRNILGPSPDGTPVLPQLQTEAFILGQLAVRIINAPIWWTESANGLNLTDPNILYAIYDKILEIDNKNKKQIEEQIDKTTSKLKEKINNSESNNTTSNTKKHQ